MDIFKQSLSVLLISLLIGCATPPPKGSVEEAIHNAWNDYCKAGYCEGHYGVVSKIHDNYITVNINGNIRYLRYTVSGTTGNYKVDMTPTEGYGRIKP